MVRLGSDQLSLVIYFFFLTRRLVGIILSAAALHPRLPMRFTSKPVFYAAGLLGLSQQPSSFIRAWDRHGTGYHHSHGRGTNNNNNNNNNNSNINNNNINYRS